MAIQPQDQSFRQLSGAEVVLWTLQHAGVEVMFGLPGGAILTLYETLKSFPGLKHVLTRHEQGAGHAASGYAQATGRLGVCIATSGPGATNLVTALMDAHMYSITDICCSVVAPITKHAVEATEADNVGRAMSHAISQALSGRPGPVLVSITKDALAGSTCFVAKGIACPFTAPSPTVEPRLIQRAVEHLTAAERPVLYVGGRVISSNDAAELRELAEMLNLPVVTTLMARGAFPDDHRQHVGMPGMHGTVAAVAALQEADLLLVAGARFDGRVTGELSSFAPGATVVHIDIDAAELSGKRRADVALHADCGVALAVLIEHIRVAGHRTGCSRLTAWWKTLNAWRSRYPIGYVQDTKHSPSIRDRASGGPDCGLETCLPHLCRRVVSKPEWTPVSAVLATDATRAL
ncbi:thiamine pyrophosphate-binding protein [Streptomyces sp. NPDC002506]|uniref:thiamine pyrophosphate-binding protein n=1 Tax=Streptomyces sp. NPDC002506 TaxID=3154536 RepID=UPI00331DD01E